MQQDEDRNHLMTDGPGITQESICAFLSRLRKLKKPRERTGRSPSCHTNCKKEARDGDALPGNTAVAGLGGPGSGPLPAGP